jgi:hypothetical protein
MHWVSVNLSPNLKSFSLIRPKCLKCHSLPLHKSSVAVGDDPDSATTAENMFLLLRVKLVMACAFKCQ